jgi:hypothetical protein
MTVIEFLAVDAIKDLLQATVFFRIRQNIQAERSCRRWVVRRRIPVAGWLIKSQAGAPQGKVEQFRNDRLTKAIRWFVATATFDDLVGMLLNRNSKLRQRMDRKAKQVQANSGRVDIVS